MRIFSRLALLAGVACAVMTTPVLADSFLEGFRHHNTVASTVTDNGDLNPYAVVIAPVSAGKIHQGDVLVDNFNNISNLQGTGGTIIAFNPKTSEMTLFAKLPQKLDSCPGGIGLTTAMTMLKSGWVIVGSLPSTDGTTRTKGPGCLLVFNANGDLKAVWSGSHIDGPWGNMAVDDQGAKATLFVSMSGSGVTGPDKIDPATAQPVVVRKASVLRITIDTTPANSPKVLSQTVVADGLGERADKDVFLVGPTGVALIGSTLYVSDAVDNRIVAIPDALTRKTSAGTGREITRDGLLQRPLALIVSPNGHLITTNAKNGQVVEIDPSGKQIVAKWADTNPAQQPPGNGDLFGLAIAPGGDGYYYVEDDVNTLVKATP